MIIKAHYIMHALALIDSLLVHSVEIMMHGKIAEARSQNSSRTHATCEGVYTHDVHVCVYSRSNLKPSPLRFYHIYDPTRARLYCRAEKYFLSYSRTDICSAATFRGAIISAMSSVTG